MIPRIALLLLAMSPLAAHGMVSLAFSNSIGNVAEGWANSAGDTTVRMAWGIVVDTQGDGFDGFASAASTPSDGGMLITAGANYAGGFILTPTNNLINESFSTLPAGQLLSLQNGQLTDDRLFISAATMPLVGGDVRISTLNTMIYDANMAAGDKYAIVWFDVTSLRVEAPVGSKYGAWYKDGTAPNNGTLLPADPGTYSTPGFGPVGMFGPDGSSSTKVASLTLVPEPSAALLGLVGAAALMRRRRR